MSLYNIHTGSNRRFVAPQSTLIQQYSASPALTLKQQDPFPDRNVTDESDGGIGHGSGICNVGGGGEGGDLTQ